MLKTVRPLRYSDFDLVFDKYCSSEEQQVVEKFRRAYLHNPAETGCFNDFPVAMWGLAISWPGLAQAWTIISPVATRYPLWLTKSVRTWMVRTALNHNLQRLEATARVDDPMAGRWLETLGYELDGYAKLYGPDGMDHIRYVYYPKEFM